MRKISIPLLNVAEILIPSKAELFDLTGKITIEEASQQIFKYGVENLIVKLGNEGSVAITKQGRIFEPAYDVTKVGPMEVPASISEVTSFMKESKKKS